MDSPASTLNSASASLGAPTVLLMPSVRLPITPTSPASVNRPKISSPSKLLRSHSATHHRSSSVSDPPPYIAPAPTADVLSGAIGTQWLGLPLRFRITTEYKEIEGFQLYAVEKWVVERKRPVTVLAVHTGDPSHKITVTCLRPSSDLSRVEAEAEWRKALHHLRRDGARPKDTPHGIIMATSLAHFRSDFTIVYLPGGNYLSVQEQLYSNINLSRTGCSGRSALTLEDSSEATKDRFLSMYHLPDCPAASDTRNPQVVKPSRSDPDTALNDGGQEEQSGRFLSKTTVNRLFVSTVLELVKLVQASLLIYGMYAERQGECCVPLDGLLCDVTIDGLQRWVRDVGEPILDVEPTERVADPDTVSAMLSIIMSVRNKLAALGYSNVVPKDPFIKPQAFIDSLTNYSSQLSSVSLPHFPHLPMHTPHLHSPAASLVNNPFTPPSGTTQGTLAIGDSATPPSYLTRQVIETINAAYEKIKHSESRKVHRVLFNKLDFTNTEDGVAENDQDGANSRSAGSESISTGGALLSGFGSLTNGLRLGAVANGAATILEPTTELEAFISNVIGKPKHKKSKGKGKSKDWNDALDITDANAFSPGADLKIGGVGGSVRGLWSGRVTGVVQLRQRENGADRGDNEKSPNKDARGAVSDGDAEEREVDRGKIASEDDSDYGSFGRPWSDRMQKRIDVWTGRHRKKSSIATQSVDLGGSVKSRPGRHTLRGLGLPPIYGPNGSDLLQTTPGDDEDVDLLSSGQASPIDELKNTRPFSLSMSGRSENSSASNLLSVQEYERKVSQLEHKRPWANRFPTATRITSWSDPKSARLGEDNSSLDAASSDKERPRLAHHPHSQPDSAAWESGAETGPTVGWGDTDSSGDSRSAVVQRPGIQRRRSWADHTSHRDIQVLSPEHMRIDVELCGQYLIMIRREDHLSNVCECLELLTASISEVNTFLREDLERNLPLLAEADDRSKITAIIESEKVKCDQSSQEVQTLKYEFNLFRLPDLWHLVNPPRQRILQLRAKVFGMGGRQLAPGTKGAHGAFNRLQWRLDGTKVLVDHLGRTESEAEEDEGYGQAATESGALHGEEQMGTVVRNPSVKPMWLLRLFTSWGARWNNLRSTGPTAQEQPESEGQAASS